MTKLIIGLGNRCIDVSGASPVDGTAIILYDQNGGANQLWNFTQDGHIESTMAPGKCLDIKGGLANNNASIILSDKKDILSQKWSLEDNRLVSKADPNKCIDVQGAKNENGIPLVIWDKKNLDADNQKWKFADFHDLNGVFVPGFIPSKNGLHFPNSFNHTPDYKISIGLDTINIGDAANGLCGGMIYAVRDMFEAGITSPIDTTSPDSGSLFDYITKRLLDSFDLPGGPVTYMQLMNPALPDHETVASKAGLAPRGRAWITVKQEWPKIKADLDSGMLSVMALVEEKSLNPGDMGKNHQVLAYGYNLNGSDLKIYIYDPNCPDNNNIFLSLNIGNPDNTTTIGSTCSDKTIHCFFRTNYRFSLPPSFIIPSPIPNAKFTVMNDTDIDQVIRVYNFDDTVMLIALTAGEFTVRAKGSNGNSASWVFQNGITKVKVTANGRLLGIFTPTSADIHIKSEGKLTVNNETNNIQVIRVYNASDSLMLVALPGGEFSIDPIGTNKNTGSWVFPSGIEMVKLTANNRPLDDIVRPGGSITVVQDDSIVVINKTHAPIKAKFYKSDDVIMAATLPGGDLPVQPDGNYKTFTVPIDVRSVKIIIGATTRKASMGDVIIYN